MSILENFYYGKCNPSERIKSKDTEFELISQRITDAEEALKTKLPEQNYKLIEELSDLQDVLISLLSASAYIEGYKMGALMMIEVFDGKGEVI
ncbi:DUF6809 family protein [Paenibacillus ottowii]|uniref:NTP pyrophosphohydrolase MazG putative catalytic core domain-containing protein n=1 Tax=Paenibacillus ottowii TaxID=2315729 RepID=A0ABY3AYR3_9BACL|nr:DUF6809 family protein [Paenibacillus ottowii]TQR95525.1 hypothetical protein FKV70_22675 [Paenibacillus ottowii]